jgi:CheY-like chemotaxis protein
MNTPSTPSGHSLTGIPAVAPVGPAAEGGRRPLILIADDNEVVLRVWESKLKAGGFDVATVGTSLAVARVAMERRPDVILLDVNFPPGLEFNSLMWSGFTVLQWLRRFNEAADIPIILISGGDGMKYKDEALARGATAFFHKDTDHKELVALIQQQIAKKSGGTTA